MVTVSSLCSTTGINIFLWQKRRRKRTIKNKSNNKIKLYTSVKCMGMLEQNTSTYITSDQIEWSRYNNYTIVLSHLNDLWQKHSRKVTYYIIYFVSQIFSPLGLTLSKGPANIYAVYQSMSSFFLLFLSNQDKNIHSTWK